jgi:uncharacterized repeat protein (TIGR01451 family)
MLSAHPLRFERNSDSTSGGGFVARARNYDILIDKGRVAIQGDRASDRKSIVQMKLWGSDGNATMDTADPLPGTSSYLIGNDPSRWRIGVPSFGRVLVRNPWAGVTLAYYGTDGRLEYDIEIAPFARIEQIRFAFEGIEDLRIAPDGALELSTSSGLLRQHAPSAYQLSGATRIPVVASYYRTGHRKIGIRLGAHDPKSSVIVDPVLSYSTFLGPTSGPHDGTLVSSPGYRVAVDSLGSAYIFGNTSSPLFPGAGGSVSGTLHGSSDLYVAKLSPDGSTLLWATYLGGNGLDEFGGIAVDTAGRVYLCGTTSSTDFPTTVGGFLQSPSIPFYNQAFVTVLNSSGTGLVYSSYLGGGGERAYAIAVGPNSVAYLTGYTTSPDFPVTTGAYLRAASYQNAFLVKVDPALSGAASLTYSSLLSQNGSNVGYSVAVDAAGMAYVTGTAGTAFPTTANAYRQVIRGYGDIFALKLDPSQAGSAALLYSTLLGGSSSNQMPCCIAVDSGGKMYVGGFTASYDFPTTPGAYQNTMPGGEQSFVAKFDPTLSGSASLLYSTFVGPTHGWNSMVVDANGSAYVAGTTTGAFPTTADAFQRNFGGGSFDGYLGKLSPQGNFLIYGTYLGGSDEDDINGMALAPGNDVIVTGFTHSTNFPLVGPVVNTIPQGVYYMGFVTRIADRDAHCTYSISPPAQSLGAQSGTGSVIVTTGLGCGWSAASNSNWIGITAGAAGSGNGTVSFATVDNDSPGARTGTLTIAGQTFTVSQAGAVCDYAMSPGRAMFTREGGQGVVNVGTLAHCPSVPSYSDPWIIQAGAWIGIGGGSLPYAISPNPTASTRTGSIQVGNAALTVTQAASNCTYSLGTAGVLISSAGGPVSIDIHTTQPACPWLARTLDTDWVSLEPTFGNGTTTLSFNIAANPVPWSSRSATVQVMDQTFTINQLGRPLLSIGSQHSDAFAAGQNGATYTVTVSNAGGAGPTSGTVTATEIVPSGMTLVSMAGNGWTCPGTAANNCMRSDALNGGASYLPITVTVNVAANAASPQVNSVSVSGGGSATATATDSTTIIGPALRFVPLTPCRIADTRNVTGPFGGPNLAAGVSRDFNPTASACGIPANALAYSLNVTVVPLAALGFFSVWPAGQPQAVVSTLNSFDGRIKANAAIVPAGPNGALTMFATDPAHLIVDINGYFVPASGAQNLAFYPVTPCRIADTRNSTGTFGGPTLAGGVARAFPVPSSSCGIPAGAQAYALNMTVIPTGPLGFLATWPSGSPQPLVSTLNALTGAVTSNAAIVPAGVNGGISVYASDTTSLIIDINGYFAQPGTGSLDFYTTTPCRVLDTRNAAGPLGGPMMGPGQARSFTVPSSACGIPAGAKAYSLNATVVPPAPLSFLTLWGSGGMPLVSTLNSFDATVVANAALVPAGAGGEVTAYTTNLSHLLLDINGYFR